MWSGANIKDYSEQPCDLHLLLSVSTLKPWHSYDTSDVI